MDNADFIASVMIVLTPIFVLVGAFVFLYKHKSEWDTEISELQKSHQHEKKQRHSI